MIFASAQFGVITTLIETVTPTEEGYIASFANFKRILSRDTSCSCQIEQEFFVSLWKMKKIEKNEKIRSLGPKNSFAGKQGSNGGFSRFLEFFMGIIVNRRLILINF